MEPKEPKWPQKAAGPVDERLEELSRRVEDLDRKIAAPGQEARESDAVLGDFASLLKGRIPQLEGELDKTRRELDAAREELRRGEGELGRLRAVAERVPELTARLDENLKELAQARADADRRISEEVKAALAAVQGEHEKAAAQWRQEKAGLEQRIKDLQAQGEPAEGGRITPSDLASRFASVLDELSEGRPATGGRAAVAALTGLEVEARGVLEAPRQGEEQPRFVTAGAGKVDPSALSTMKMTFRLLPRPAAPGSGEE